MSINGFEGITAPLAKHKFELIDVFSDKFLKSPEKTKLNHRDLIYIAQGFCGLKISDVDVRKVIHIIRCENHVLNLLSNSGGYFVSNDTDDILKYQKSLYQRASSTLETIRCNAFSVGLDFNKLLTTVQKERIL